MEMMLRFSGYLGAVLVVFGVLGALLVDDFTSQPLLVAHLVIGLVCIIAWCVTSGLQTVSKAGEVISGRTARYGYNALGYAVVFAGLIVVLNIFVAMNDHRWDLTEAGVYSLSDKSAKVVKGLKDKLKLVAIDAPQIQDKHKTEDLLKLYKYNNDSKVSYEIVDPRARPVEMDKLGMKAGNLLYIEYGEGANSAVSRINEVDEQSVTNAIIKLTRGAAKKVYYIQGHGEPELESEGQGGAKEFRDALSDEHLTVEGLLLLQKGQVPDDAAAVILAAPKKSLQQAERDAIVQYANKGGRLLLLADPENRQVDDVNEIAKNFGIEVGKDVIIDEQLRLFAGPQLAVQFVAQWFSPHITTSRLSKSEPPVFTFASSVKSTGSSNEKVTYTDLLKSGPNSWAEKNLSAIFDASEPTATKDADDAKGPISIAVAYEKKLDEAPAGSAGDEEKFDKATRVIVFGDATWLENGNLSVMTNRDLVLNVINWIAGEEGGIAVGPKNLRASIAPIRRETFNVILALSFLGPELILLFGLFVWWRRRLVLA